MKPTRQLHDQAQRTNLFLKIPGTPQGVPAIEQAILLAIPVNVTLLFSCAHYQAVAQAYLRGIGRLASSAAGTWLATRCRLVEAHAMPRRVACINNSDSSSIKTDNR